MPPRDLRGEIPAGAKMDFDRASLGLEFLELLFSSRLVLKAISSCSSKQICGHLQLYKDG